MKTTLPATAAATLLLLMAFGLAPTAALAQGKTGDAAAGQKKDFMCIGCHGIAHYQASFPEVYKVPKIAGQNAQYIVNALMEYKKGDRKFPTMHGVAASLSEQDMADLAAYYSMQGDPRPLPETLPPGPGAELVQKGNCAACHGANLSKPIDGSYPKLAGQYADYLFVTLKAYQTTGNPHVGRSNPIMGMQVKPFSHEELKVIADYIGSLPGELRTAPGSEFK